MREDVTIMQKLFECLRESVRKPELFQAGELLFWDDPHISKSMLEAHLNPDSNGASRTLPIIEKTVEHLVRTSILKSHDKVLDLGCGPGLYSSRLCQKGIRVTGIDISKRSINYAQKKADELQLDIEYVCSNFFDITYEHVFDSVLQIYGELSTFSDEARNSLLRIVHKALKKDGLFIFDVSTRVLRMREGLGNRWYFAEDGFWQSGRHLVLEQGFDYPDNDVWLNQYTVIAEDGEFKTYRIWFHDYSLQTINEVLQDNGFKVEYVWNDLIGETYSNGGDWIAIAARKV
ncbi:MAG: hypothetical protein H6Q72_2063 [Firmicutes bacterium]|nr:hypothetical protein [Bacillota bacterium]